MIKFLRLTTTFLIFWSCSSTSDELANYFEPTQIQELSRLTEFVTDALTDNCSDDRTTCLKAYFDQYKESGSDFELTGISKSRQSKLLNSLSESTYSDIWSTCRGSKPAKNGRVKIESICPNMNGQFANFLTDYCGKTDRLADYGDTFELTGSYAPSMNAQLIKNPASFNFDSETELLLISIHLLTLNSEDRIVESVSNSR